MKKIIIFLVLLTAITACSDNSTGTDVPDLGTASLTVSGNVEGQKEGIADFNSLNIGLYTWEISINDYSPQSFDLVFMLISNNPIEQPAPGTYEIGFDPMESSVFSATYTDTEDGFVNATEYSTLFGDYGGTLVITESTDSQIKGTFEFTAADFDLELNQPNGEIAVSGMFTAKKRQN